MNLSNSNYIYTGSISHRRFTPFDHFFTYPIFMAYFDVAKVESMLKKSWFWNTNKPSIVSFYRRDYHGDEEQTLDSAVRLTVKKEIGKDITGPIRLLTHLRYYGYCFNPVSFYYCFNEQDDDVELVMAEVTNTPWQERHVYMISDRLNGEGNLTSKIKKEFHVSPFWGMNHDYEWMFTQPGENLLVNMKNFKDGEKVFDATLSMHRKKMTVKNLMRKSLRFPFLTAMVVWRIHWNAAKLWLKGAQFYTHPNKLKQEKFNGKQNES